MSEQLMRDMEAEINRLRAVNDDLVAALKEARPYVQGQYDQLKYMNSASQTRTRLGTYRCRPRQEAGGPVMSTMLTAHSRRRGHSPSRRRLL